jgi:hypothetical protein
MQTAPSTPLRPRPAFIEPPKLIRLSHRQRMMLDLQHYPANNENFDPEVVVVQNLAALFAQASIVPHIVNPGGGPD